MSVLGVTKYEDMVVGKIYSLRNITHQGREYGETITKYYKSETGMLKEMISTSESKVSNFSFEELQSQIEKISFESFFNEYNDIQNEILILFKLEFTNDKGLDFFSYNWEDFAITDYNCGPFMPMEVAI